MYMDVYLFALDNIKSHAESKLTRIPKIRENVLACVDKIENVLKKVDLKDPNAKLLVEEVKSICSFYREGAINIHHVSRPVIPETEEDITYALYILEVLEDMLSTVEEKVRHGYGSH